MLAHGMVATKYAAKKGACMKNRVWNPRAVLAAVAVIAVTLGLSTGIANASVARPTSSVAAAPVTKIHETKCTSTTLSIRYDAGKKVACYTGRGLLKVALPKATQAIAGSSDGFLFLREDGALRLVEFFPHQRLRLVGDPEVTGIELGLLHAEAPASNSSSQSTQTPGTVAFRVSVVGGNVTLVAASAADAQIINAASAASLRPAGLGCHFDWFWTWCYWKFSHATTVALWSAAHGTAIAICHKILGDLDKVVAVCASIVAWLAVRRHTEPGKDQCLEVTWHVFYGAPAINYTKC
jgi:hypothetical protein